ncbi:MAG: response regulator, partial [Syntrophobacteraceae bacterium]|nr:response regulator [Syntrophobacteraceae bacterium]
MKILLLDPGRVVSETFEQIACTLDDLKVVHPEQPGGAPLESQGIDVIIGVEHASGQGDIRDLLLSWRTNPHTCLVPCWVLSHAGPFEERCLWPRLAIDRFEAAMEASNLCNWLSEVAEWQQNRMNIGVSYAFSEHGALELATSLSLRKATGRLVVFDHEGNEGALVFHGGRLAEASLRHLRGVEAFYEFLSWSSGSYHWSPDEVPGSGAEGGDSLGLLIPQGLQLMKEANLLYHFIGSLDQPITRTDSEAALDDGAIPFYREIRKLYHFIQGDVSTRDILDISPISRPRTMGCLAKWFSLGDLRTVSRRESVPRHRLLIVDDSKLMCKALQSVFATDPRFEIVGVGHDGYEAIKLIEEKQPDVVTLDIQMPRMDGLTALKHIMIRNPKPVVILSAFTKETSQLTYDSFKYGAVDVFAKPVSGTLEAMEEDASELRNRIVQASCVRIEAAQYIRRVRRNGSHGTDEGGTAGESTGLSQHGAIVALCGAGGFPSLLKLLLALPRSSGLPPFLACMALSRKVVEALIPNLQKDSLLRVEKITDNAPLASGGCYLYSHEDSVQVQRDETGNKLRISQNHNGIRRPFDTILRSAAD